MAKIIAAQAAFIAGGGNVLLNPSFLSPAEEKEYSAAWQIVSYFSTAPALASNKCSWK
jgi:hypothetical protein